MRIPSQSLGIQPHPVQHLKGKFPLFGRLDQAVMYRRLGHYLDNLLTRIQRGKRILKNHLCLQVVGWSVMGLVGAFKTNLSL